MSLTNGDFGPDFMTGSMEREMERAARANAPAYPTGREQRPVYTPQEGRLRRAWTYLKKLI